MKRVGTIVFVFLALTYAAASGQASSGPNHGSVSVPTQAGMPFLGEEEVSTIASFGDRTMLKTTGTVARDRMGRVYRESRSPAQGSFPEELFSTTVYDPIAKTSTSCDVNAKVCRVFALAAAKNEEVDLRRVVTHEPQKSEERDGLAVSGARESLAVTPPMGGEARTVMEESLFSTDLQMRLYQLTKDPLSGTRTVRVEILSRAEPDPALFKVPEGYVVQDRRSASTASTRSLSEAPGEHISAPVVLFAPEPDLRNVTDKTGGRRSVLVYLLLPPTGKPIFLQILRGAGGGLDEAALEAVAKYRMKPATRAGAPIPVEMNVGVSLPAH